MIRILPTVLIVSGLLLCTGCMDPVPGAPHRIPGEENGSRTFTMPDTCPSGPLAWHTYPHWIGDDSCYFESHTPMDLLDELRMNPSQPVLVPEAPPDWITLPDAALLMQEIDQTDPAAPVVSQVSSYWPVNETSTVGNEALFLLEGYRAGRYPPRICSLHYFRPDHNEIRSWWDGYGRSGLIDSREAIRIVQNTYPDLLAYPSEDLPPRSIRAEHTPDGWYLAFIQEGSGLPILSARCFLVTQNRTVIWTGTVNRSLMVLPEQFSPLQCGEVNSSAAVQLTGDGNDPFCYLPTCEAQGGVRYRTCPDFSPLE